jgi:hypothetical protein
MFVTFGLLTKGGTNLSSSGTPMVAQRDGWSRYLQTRFLWRIKACFPDFEGLERHVGKDEALTCWNHASNFGHDQTPTGKFNLLADLIHGT